MNTKAKIIEDIKEGLLKRFLSYVAIDTQSDEASESFPSTKKQFDLLEKLKQELIEMGLEQVLLDEYGYVMAKLPASQGYESAPKIGLVAHVDTSPDMSGKNIKPQIIEDYQGGIIKLNEDYELNPSYFPEMNKLIGHQLITTDGTTLLGADDKAGVSEIMTCTQYLIDHPELKHGDVLIGFTPDEEVGRGVDFFDVAKFGADFAYTIDGGEEGELEYENFNAASARIIAKGLNVHPGYAKGKMINALSLLTELDRALPVQERPEYTQDYEGFYHLIALNGEVDKAEAHYIIRDHDKELFEEKKKRLQELVDKLNDTYESKPLSLELKDQYYNMKEMVEPYPKLISLAEEAMQQAGVKPLIRPIRGGTDGARLSYMGLPCPNLFTGGANFHGRFEYASFTTMTKLVVTLVNLLCLWAEEKVK